jgi:hypothetical protein
VSDWEIIQHAVAISGRVINAQTSKGVGRARVEITAGPAEFMNAVVLKAAAYGRGWAGLQDRPDRKLTAADGHFHFLDLPNGTYTLTATVPGSGSRFGTAQSTPAVSRDSLGNLIMTTADILISPTTLTGRITDQGSSDPVFMARIQVVGSNETTYSDDQGDYRLTGLETGHREIKISAQGYTSASDSVDLTTAGTAVTHDIALSPTGPLPPAPVP